MYDFGIEEKEFQLMLDVATEKMEMNEVTFNLISNTMHRVRDSGKLSEYDKTQVSLLCNKFSIAIEKLNNKTEYEVAMEEMSGGMMALVAAAILAISALIAKILGFFSGSSGSSSNSGGGGSGGSVENIEKNKKAIDESKKTFTLMIPEINYVTSKIEKIEKEILKLAPSDIELIGHDSLKEAVNKMKDTNGNIFMLISDKDYNHIINLCNAKGGHIFINSEFSNRGSIKNIENKIANMTSIINSVKEELKSTINDTKMSELIKAEIEFFVNNAPDSSEQISPIGTLAIRISDLNAMIISKTNEILSDDDSIENSNNNNTSADYGVDRSFMNNIIFKRDEYPNIFNTFASDIAKGSDFIRNILEMVTYSTSFEIFTKAIGDLLKVENTNDERIKENMKKLLSAITSLISSIATTASKSMHITDRACDLTHIFFDTLVCVAGRIGLIHYSDKLKETDLYKLITEFRNLHGGFIVSCKKLTEINYVKGSQLDNSKMGKLIKHISKYDIHNQ